MDWPPLPYGAWKETYATLHRYLQIIGKVQLKSTQLAQHFWNAALLPSAVGLRTPLLRHANGAWDIELDFTSHQLTVRTLEGKRRTLELRPRAVCDFYSDVMGVLSSLQRPVTINTRPQELTTEVIPLDQDRKHASYDADAVARWARIVRNIAVIFDDFQARFAGKYNPSQFWWGSFDLAATRFTGRKVSPPKGGGYIERESFNEELSDVGFWPGDASLEEPALFAYAYPAPEGYGRATIRPQGTYFMEKRGFFILPYEKVRTSPDPRRAIEDFCQSTYEAAAGLGRWDRAALERSG